MKRKRLLTGLAGAAALAGASQTYGTVVVLTPPANIPGNDPTANTDPTPTRVFIDLDGNSTNDLEIAYRSFNTMGYYIQQSFVLSFTGQTAAYGPVGTQDQYYAYQLAGGDAIPGSNPFGQNMGMPPFLTHVATNVNGNNYGFWALGDRGFIGFSFRDANNQLDYGYIELETDAFMSAGDPGGIQFFSLAYETSGGPIAAGAVPEPSTLAALAFGGVGLAAAAFRRRQKADRKA